MSLGPVRAGKGLVEQMRGWRPELRGRHLETRLDEPRPGDQHGPGGGRVPSRTEIGKPGLDQLGPRQGDVGARGHTRILRLSRTR